MADKIYDLFDMCVPDVQEWLKKTDLILVPVGSLEQHGPHCPLGTDSISAWEITKRIARKADVPHTPLIWMGYSPHHMRPPGQGAGTITLRSETYRRLIYDVARSLIHHGFNKIVFVAGHGSLIKVVDDVLRAIRYETGALVVWYMAYAERNVALVKDLCETLEGNPGWHAGEIEASQDMAYKDGVVRMERAKKPSVHGPRWLPEAFHKHDGAPTITFGGYDGYIWMPLEHHEYSDDGTVGDPFKASKEKGEKLFERFADYGARIVNELKKVKVEVKNREFVERAWI
ncbi:MAG: creatininase family protein [Candidatus Bathyarchaeia archaeon]